MRAEVNVAKAVLSAEAALEDDPQKPPDRRVDEDWLFRWRDSASKVSVAELQALWGRVLAGEIKSPGTFFASDSGASKEFIDGRGELDRDVSALRR